MIDVAGLSGFTREMIKELVDKENTTDYEIFVPKSAKLFFSEKSEMVADYVEAAYSGQQLANIAEAFDYDPVSPETYESILFEVRTSDIDKLTDTILQITYVYVNDHPEDESFRDELYQYIDDVNEGKIQPACPYFIEIINEIANEIEEENEDNDS
jgi:hypothetical protein